LGDVDELGRSLEDDELHRLVGQLERCARAGAGGAHGSASHATATSSSSVRAPVFLLADLIWERTVLSSTPRSSAICLARCPSASSPTTSRSAGVSAAPTGAWSTSLVGAGAAGRASIR